jgi:hypothetical protein
MLACIGGGLFVALLLIGMDEAPPDDSDLLVQRLSISDAENGMTYLDQAREVLYWPKTSMNAEFFPQSTVAESTGDEGTQADPPQSDESRIEEMLADKAWYPALAADILERNSETLRLFDKALACAEFQCALPTRIEESKMESVVALLDLGRLLLFRARATAKKGSGAAALKQAGDLVELGHRLERSKGNVLAYLIGMTLKQMGLEAIFDCLKNNEASSADLKAFAARMARYADESEGLVTSLGVEYESTWMITEDAATSLPAKSTSSKPVSPRVIACWRQLVRLGVVWKPHATQKLLVDLYRSHVQLADKTLTYIDQQDAAAVMDKPGPIRYVLAGNYLGRWLYGLWTPSLQGLLVQKVRCRTEFSANLTLIALKAYQVDHGRLPRTLDELVPAYLPAVPLDDYDGKPIRYSYEKKVVYSVGKDFKDDGGMTREEARQWWNQNKRTDMDGPLGDDEEPDLWQLPDPSCTIDF